MALARHRGDCGGWHIVHAVGWVPPESTHQKQSYCLCQRTVGMYPAGSSLFRWVLQVHCLFVHPVGGLTVATSWGVCMRGGVFWWGLSWGSGVGCTWVVEVLLMVSLEEVWTTTGGCAGGWVEGDMGLATGVGRIRVLAMGSVWIIWMMWTSSVWKQSKRKNVLEKYYMIKFLYHSRCKNFPRSFSN